MAHAHPKPWTVEEFLEWERSQEERYEYIGGMIVGMVGGTVEHARLIRNGLTLLTEQLRGGPCEAFALGLKVLVGEEMFYPDIAVACSPQTAQDDRLQAPVVIIEVLSRTTEGFDRGRKWSTYSSIDSLQHFVLVSQREQKVEAFSRDGGGWHLAIVAGDAGVVDLPAIGARLPLARLYERTQLQPDGG